MRQGPRWVRVRSAAAAGVPAAGLTPVCAHDPPSVLAPLSNNCALNVSFVSHGSSWLAEVAVAADASGAPWGELEAGRQVLGPRPRRRATELNGGDGRGIVPFTEIDGWSPI